MVSHETHIRVRYADTDQMGYVYHGKFVEFLEVGRTELVRAYGMPYAKVEERGILMPVAEIHMNYRSPAYYDDLLTIRTTVNQIPKASFIFDYEVYREGGQLVLTGQVKLAFVDKVRKRPVRVPDFIMELLQRALES